MNKDLVVVYTANGHMEAEMITMLLKSEGIPSEAVQESYGITMGLTVGYAGKADILVPAAYEQQARKIIDAMEDNTLASSDDEGDEADTDSSENAS